MWVGSDLGPIEEAALKSWLGLGYEFDLYTDTPNLKAPEGTRVKSLFEFVDRERTVGRHSNALADELRYRLLKNQNTTWVDMDIIGLKPLPDSDLIFGLEDDFTAAIAVLKLPKESEVLSRMLERIESPRRHVVREMTLGQWKRLLSTRQLLDFFGSQPFSAHQISGPRPFTKLLKETGIFEHALPISAFYPVYYKCSSVFFENGTLQLEDTYALHLGQAVREIVAKTGIPKGCKLEGLIQVAENNFLKSKNQSYS
jgi:hypothetical protein